jgi:membrane protein DedA with SNARE-associated domain
MADWVIRTIESTGYLGIIFLMFLENVFPPIPSEVIVPLAGFMVAEGKHNLLGVIVSGTIGSVLGALPLYYAGYFLGEERLKAFADKHGRWLTVSREDLERAKKWFDQHGRLAVLICRVIPGIRSLISIPAGIAKMNIASFVSFTALGAALWTALLAFAGYILGAKFEKIGEYLNPASYLVLAAILVIYVKRVLTGNRKSRRKKVNSSTSPEQRLCSGLGAHHSLGTNRGPADPD